MSAICRKTVSLSSPSAPVLPFSALMDSPPSPMLSSSCPTTVRPAALIMDTIITSVTPTVMPLMVSAVREVLRDRLFSAFPSTSRIMPLSPPFRFP